jgi:uncharacterized protein (DUF58 family)
MSGPGAAETRPPADIPYRLAWRSPSPRAGVHRGRHDGSGGRFRDLVPILNHPDPRRVDLRATIRDPSAQLFVRRFDQPAAIALYALVDVSASMGVGDGGDKLGTASALVGALAASARKAGDAFGLIGFDGVPRVASAPRRPSCRASSPPRPPRGAARRDWRTRPRFSARAGSWSSSFRIFTGRPRRSRPASRRLHRTTS